MSRAATILDRFPRHLEVGAPGKLFGVVVGELAGGLDVQTTQVGQVRRAHRLGDAETERDILALAALHGLRRDVLAVIARRVDPATADYDTRLDLVRATVSALIGVHRTGNGTVAGLLSAAATYTGLVVEEVSHSNDRFWHVARCHDLVVGAGSASAGPGAAEPTAPDLLALEENPYQARDIQPVPRRHGDLFRILRGGFDDVPVTVIVRGVEDRTVRPMVVNVDTGVGVATTIDVPAGEELRFERDGRVTLSGSSVARLSYTFSGAVFANGAGPHGKDFVFVDETAPEGTDTSDRGATYARTHPIADAFDPTPSFPHLDGILLSATLERGQTRWAFFTGAGVFATVDDGGEVLEAAPRPVAGVFDRSVFDPDPAGPPSAEIGLAWEEREPFAVRVWLPLRLADLDTAGEVPVRERVRGLLDRHRAGGVHVYVAYADPRWTLGTGLLRDLDSIEALGVVVAGTATWDADTPQPAPT